MGDCTSFFNETQIKKYYSNEVKFTINEENQISNSMIFKENNLNNDNWTLTYISIGFFEVTTIVVSLRIILMLITLLCCISLWIINDIVLLYRKKKKIKKRINKITQTDKNNFRSDLFN